MSTWFYVTRWADPCVVHSFRESESSVWLDETSASRAFLSGQCFRKRTIDSAFFPSEREALEWRANRLRGAAVQHANNSRQQLAAAEDATREACNLESRLSGMAAPAAAPQEPALAASA